MEKMSFMNTNNFGNRIILILLTLISIFWIKNGLMRRLGGMRKGLRGRRLWRRLLKSTKHY